MEATTNRYQLYCGDSMVKLQDFAENSIDSCVMDPPYGIRFMGKAWDSFDIQTKADKRNSYQLGRTRAKSGRKADGFGRSIEAGKYNLTLEANHNFQEWIRLLSIEILRVLKPGAYFLCFGSTRTGHRMTAGIEDAGFEIRDTMMWVFSSGFPKSHNLSGDFEGYGSALKPAYEPIVMARKPLDGTIAENMAKWGVGALNIDGCRVAGDSWTFGTQTDIRGGGYGSNRPSEGNILAKNVESNPLGRWPANLTHDGSEDVRSGFPESTGQNADLEDAPSDRAIFGNSLGLPRNFQKRIDQDKSAARFFYCAKTSRTDRNEGCEHLEELKSSHDGRTKLIENAYNSNNSNNSNNHPTVKPTDLMRYLVRLVTPVGGTTIDPCCGSGSTIKGALIEGCNAIGIDVDQHNIDISTCRAKFVLKNLDMFGFFNKPK